MPIYEICPHLTAFQALKLWCQEYVAQSIEYSRRPSNGSNLILWSLEVILGVLEFVLIQKLTLQTHNSAYF